MHLIVLIDKLIIDLCIEYRCVLLLQSAEKKITIFFSVGILEHSPLFNAFSCHEIEWLLRSEIKLK